MSKASLFAGYRGGEEMPLGGYAVLLGVYSLGLAGLAALGARRERRLPDRPQAGDLLLLGVATHKLTRLITRDWVTAPLRAPFTEYQGSRGAGEVRERSRGTGIRRALGDLLTCPYCTGPWVAGALTCGLVIKPKVTRSLAGLFAVVALSDFLHQAYKKVAEV